MDESSWTPNYSQWLDAYSRNDQELHNSQSPIPPVIRHSQGSQAMAGSQMVGSSHYEDNMQAMAAASCSQPLRHLSAAHFGHDQRMPLQLNADQSQSAGPNPSLQAMHMATTHLYQGEPHLQPELYTELNTTSRASSTFSGPSYPFPSQLGVQCARCMSVTFVCCKCWRTFVTQTELQQHIEQGRHQR